MKKEAEIQSVRSIVQFRDPVMEPVIQKMIAASRVTSNVVITGESGTGKELVARALHQCGPRHHGPFVAFNCAALPDSLVESELFGYVRGAFTDARENKTGIFARANGGTLFLDEIGDASLMIQAKLLRVLQEREVLPLGGTAPIRLNMRIVAATHKSLAEEIERGFFRQDLFYRLSVIPIHLPPLRERPLDILFLAEYFALHLSEQMQLVFHGITPEGRAKLRSYSWPGNARELQNRIELALVLSQGGWITGEALFPEDLDSRPNEEVEKGDLETSIPSPTRFDPPMIPSFGEAKRLFERSYLERVLRAACGNITRAARLAVKSRAEIYTLLRKHRLDPMGFKRTSKSNASHAVETCDPLLRNQKTKLKSHA